MSVDLTALLNELTLDPAALGYTGSDDSFYVDDVKIYTSDPGR